MKLTDPYPKRSTSERMRLVMASGRYDGRWDNARTLWDMLEAEKPVAFESQGAFKRFWNIFCK